MRRVKYREHFKNLRDEWEGMNRKITQKEFGTLLGLSASAISDLERGKREPTTTELKAYHKAFNVPFEYLLGFSNSKDYNNTDLAQELGLSDNTINLLKRSKMMNLGIIELINELSDTEEGFKFMLTLIKYLHSEHFLFINPTKNKEKPYLDEIEIQNCDGSIDKVNTNDIEEVKITKLICILQNLKKEPIKMDWKNPERSKPWLTYKRERMLKGK